MLQHLNLRARGELALERLLENLEKARCDRGSSRGDREREAVAIVELAVGLYEAGRISDTEYTFLTAWPLMTMVRDQRWTDGVFDSELSPLVAKMRQIESSYGLTEDESWPLGEGPPEYQDLEAEYESIVDNKMIEVFREFGQDRLAELWEKDRGTFERLFEMGRRTWFKDHDQQKALKQVIEQYEREALVAGEAHCYYAACSLLGAAVEARLLARCLSDSETVSTAVQRLDPTKRPKDSNPLGWSLSNLLDVAAAAGWLPNLKDGVAVYGPLGWGHRLRRIRNLLHPARHVKERPHNLIGKNEYEDAKAAHLLIVSLLASTQPHGRRRSSGPRKGKPAKRSMR